MLASRTPSRSLCKGCQQAVVAPGGHRDANARFVAVVTGVEGGGEVGALDLREAAAGDLSIEKEEVDLLSFTFKLYARVEG